MRLAIIFVLISIVLGGALSSLNSGHVSLESIVTGGFIGFCIASICAVGHFAFLYRLRYLPFTAHLLGIIFPRQALLDQLADSTVMGDMR